jgi:AcrR family transcriptional regulator
MSGPASGGQASAADARRDALVDRVADYILREGLDAATLRPLARASGTSDRMLLYYFPDKQALLAAAADRVAARLMALLATVPATPQPPAALEAQLTAAAQDPAVAPYLALWLDIAARAARGDAFWRAQGQSIGKGFLRFIADRLALPPEDRPATARALLARIEGGILLAAFGL